MLSRCRRDTQVYWVTEKWATKRVKAPISQNRFKLLAPRNEKFPPRLLGQVRNCCSRYLKLLIKIRKTSRRTCTWWLLSLPLLIYFLSQLNEWHSSVTREDIATWYTTRRNIGEHSSCLTITVILFLTRDIFYR